MKIEVVFNSDEIRKNLAYALICTTRESSAWNTRRRHEGWQIEFTEKERRAASEIFAQCHQWYLVTGVPDTVRMSMSTLNLWRKLEAFCCAL